MIQCGKSQWYGQRRASVRQGQHKYTQQQAATSARPVANVPSMSYTPVTCDTAQLLHLI